MFYFVCGGLKRPNGKAIQMYPEIGKPVRMPQHYHLQSLTWLTSFKWSGTILANVR
jgi:hypothetical protein